MRRLRRMAGGFLALFQKNRLEQDLDSELRDYLENAVEHKMSQGMSRDEALRAARAEAGSLEAVKERVRDVGWESLAETFWKDVRYALRTFGKNPGFTLIAVLTLALGIGANSAIFSVVNAVVLRPLPFKDSDRLVEMFENIPGNEGQGGTPLQAVLPLGALAEFRSHMQTLSDVGAYLGSTMTLAGRDGPLRLSGVQVSAAVLRMLGAKTIVGRIFEEREETVGAAGAIIISHGFWQRYLGATPNIIGRTLTLNGRGYAVVGVMERGFQFPDTQSEFWLPLVPPTEYAMYIRPPMIARLKPGVSIKAAVAELNDILPGLQENAPPDASARIPGQFRYGLVRVQDRLIAPVAPGLMVLTAAVGFVLLIACVNVANLLLGQSSVRRREIAVRRAIGAGTRRLVRQVLTESVVLALAGGLAGTGLAFAGIRLLRTLGASLPRRDLGIGMSIPRLEEIGIDGSVFVFVFVISILTGLLFGLAPAIRQSRANLMDVLREGNGARPSGFRLFGPHAAQNGLVIVEIASAILLLIGGGLLIHSFINLSNVKPGYNPRNVLTFQLFLPQRQSPEPLNIKFEEGLVERLQSLNGVQSAGYALQLPMVQMRMSAGLRTHQAVSGQTEPESPPGPGAATPEWPDTRYVSQDFLKAMGMRVIAGRGFHETDREGAPPVLLINETLARSGFFRGNPVGQLVYSEGSAPWEIVGIVEDVRQMGLDQEPGPQMFVNIRQVSVPPPPDSSGPYFALRTNGNPISFLPDVRAVVRQFAPEVAVDNAASMDQVVSNSISRPRLYAVLLGIFAGIALILAAIGIYGVMAYSVAQRTREIGIRVALGAERSEVMALVLRQGLRLTAIGIGLGLAGGLAVTRYLNQMLFGITPLDPATFIVVSLVFALVAMAAAYVPARRATRVDPLIALRCE